MATLTIADLDNGKRDLQTVDAVANSREDFTQSRYGDSVLTLAGALRRLGYQAPVPYASGLNVTTGLFTVERDGVVYAPVASRVPFTTGEWDESQWRVVQNTNDDRRAFVFSSKLEADLAATSLPDGQYVDALDVQERYEIQGGTLIFVENLRATQLADIGSERRFLDSKLSDVVTPLDFGAVGDGSSLDDSAFSSIESSSISTPVEMLGRTYAVTSVPTGKSYKNGFFSVGGVIYPSGRQGVLYTDSPLLSDGPGLGSLKLGIGALQNSSHALTTDSIAVGRDSMRQTAWSRMNIAIGAGTMSKNNVGSANIALGAWSLTNVTGLNSSVSEMTGSRNIGIGTLSGHFLTTGHTNTLIGRDAGHSITTGNGNVATGYRALSCGHAPVGLTGQITNQTPMTSTGNAALGTNAATSMSGNFNVAIGGSAGANYKSSFGNTIIGSEAGLNIDSNVGFNNKPLVTPAVTAATYTQTGSVITVTATGHGGVAGNYLFITFNSGGISSYTRERQWLQIASVLDENRLTINSPTPLDTSGSATIGGVEVGAAIVSGNSNVIIGRQACGSATSIGGSNVVVGSLAFNNCTNGAEYNVSVGTGSGLNFQSGFNNAFIGRNSGQLMIDGTSLSSVNNSTMLGANSRCSAGSQVQLGSSGTTTYAYGAVQDRSDARDKADVRDTVLGLDFINALRPVDFKWDMRDDYVQTHEDGVVEILPKDGSKKRNRYHHGVIAQELRAVMEKHGVDFGGFQDHSINGGCDVLSVGYTELIAPLIKAVQELSSRVKELEER